MENIFNFIISKETIAYLITSSSYDELESQYQDYVDNSFSDIKNGIIEEVSNFLKYTDNGDELILTVPATSLYDVTHIVIHHISLASTVYMDDITSIIPLGDIRENLAGTEILFNLEELLDSEVER